MMSRWHFTVTYSETTGSFIAWARRGEPFPENITASELAFSSGDIYFERGKTPELALENLLLSLPKSWFQLFGESLVVQQITYCVGVVVSGIKGAGQWIIKRIL